MGFIEVKRPQIDFPLPHNNPGTGRAPARLRPSLFISKPAIPTFFRGSCSRIFPVPCARRGSRGVSGFHLVNVKFEFLNVIFVTFLSLFVALCTFIPIPIPFPPSQLCLEETNGKEKFPKNKKKCPNLFIFAFQQN